MRASVRHVSAHTAVSPICSRHIDLGILNSPSVAYPTTWQQPSPDLLPLAAPRGDAVVESIAHPTLRTRRRSRCPASIMGRRTAAVAQSSFCVLRVLVGKKVR